MLKFGNRRTRSPAKNFELFPRNRSGWIEVVEAVFSILLIAGVVLIIINKNSFESSDVSDKIYNIEVSILREVQTNDTIRGDIANAQVTESAPLSWNDEGFPQSIKDKVSSRIPNYLNCTAKICLIDSPCNLEGSMETNIYSQSVPITVTLNQEVYRQLNLFCWQK